MQYPTLDQLDSFTQNQYLMAAGIMDPETEELLPGWEDVDLETLALDPASGQLLTHDPDRWALVDRSKQGDHRERPPEWVDRDTGEVYSSPNGEPTGQTIDLSAGHDGTHDALVEVDSSSLVASGSVWVEVESDVGSVWLNTETLGVAVSPGGAEPDPVPTQVVMDIDSPAYRMGYSIDPGCGVVG